MIIGGYVVHAVTTMDQVVLPYIGQIHAWQLTFLIVGPPGIIVALFVAALREPKRQGVASGTALKSIPLEEVLAFVKRHRRSLTLHHLGVGLTSMSAFGALSWTPALLARVHDWPSDRIGLSLGIAIMIGGVLGFVGGGWLGDRLSVKAGYEGRLRVGMLVALAALPATLIYSWHPNPYVTVALVGIIYMCAAGSLPSAVAVLNELAPNQMRGQLSALFIFTVNIVGLGFGATLVALASDYLFTGETGLRYALVLTTPIGYVLSAICFRLSYKAFAKSFANAG